LGRSSSTGCAGTSAASLIAFFLAALRHTDLLQPDLLALAVARLHDEPTVLAVQRHGLITELPEEVDRFLRRLAQSQRDLARSHARLQRRAHLIFSLEEAIRRHQPVDPLVRTEVVVVRKPVRQSLARLVQILRTRALPKLRANRVPKPLALAQRLGMVRARHHVLDPLALQELSEVALAAPGEVLAALIGEHLLGLAKARNAFHQALGHELLALVRRERPAHDVARAVVQEHGQVHTRRVTRQEEARDVRLPQLVGLGTLEAGRRHRLLLVPPLRR
jgi:hypothetical protein